MPKIFYFTIIILLLIRLYWISSEKTNIDPLNESSEVEESPVRKYYKIFKNIIL